jgi:hypothetical protein
MKEAVMTDKPKIEKGVPIPKHRRYTSKWGDILADMKVGESFAVPDKLLFSVRGAVKHHVKFHGKGKAWLIQRDNGRHYRCWRTK